MAVLLVVAAHSLPHAGGGQIGVNIFFTLSGFLITGLLLAEWRTCGRILYGNFYARRALRLLPGLILLMVLVALLPDVYLTLLDGESMSRAVTIPVALLYVSNYVQGFGYPLGYLAHTWSLSVEEQFYLLWPVALAFLAATGRLRRWLPWLIVVFAMSRIAFDLAGAPGVGGWLTANADQLLIGALLAVWTQPGEPAWAGGPKVGWLALGTLAGMALLLSATRQGSEGVIGLSGGLTVIGLATAALIAHLSNSNGALRRLFSWAPAVAIGRVSYGIYLYHFPIFQYVQHQRWDRKWLEILVEYTATAAMVLISWFLVERPALRWKDRLRRQAVAVDSRS